MIVEMSLSEKVAANLHRKYEGFSLSLCAGKVGELLVTAILPGGLQEVLNEKDTEEKQEEETIFVVRWSG